MNHVYTEQPDDTVVLCYAPADTTAVIGPRRRDNSTTILNLMQWSKSAAHDSPAFAFRKDPETLAFNVCKQHLNKKQ